MRYQMLTLDQIFNKKKSKLTKAQIANTLYKLGHITKEEKEYLDEVDQQEEKRASLDEKP